MSTPLYFANLALVAEYLALAAGVVFGGGFTVVLIDRAVECLRRPN